MLQQHTVKYRKFMGFRRKYQHWGAVFHVDRYTTVCGKIEEVAGYILHYNGWSSSLCGKQEPMGSRSTQVVPTVSMSLLCDLVNF